MMKVLLTMLVMMFSLVLAGCETSEKEVEVIVSENQITNMSQLGFDMTNLQGIENNDQKVMFLSNIPSKPAINFDANLEGLSVESVDNYTYVGMNSNGAYVYDNHDLKTSLTKTFIDGGMQILYEMKEKNSPKTFELDIALKEGSRMEKTDIGEYVILDSNDEIEFLLGQAWAVDNNGDFVESYYEVSGNRIRQVVNYEGEDYPVKADPFFVQIL